jgi:PAS domain S-box-containing protein
MPHPRGNARGDGHPYRKTGIVMKTRITPIKKMRQASGPKSCPAPTTGLESVLRASTSLSVFIIDRTGMFLFWNDGAAKLFGYDSEEIVAKQTVAALAAEQVGAGVEMVARAWEFCSRNQRGASYEMLNRTKEGATIWMNWHFIPLVDKKGNVDRLLGLGENVTARKIAERHMVESQERYVTLVRLLPDIVFVVDSNGIFTFINESVGALGYTPEDLIGKHYKILIHPDDYAGVSRATVLTGYLGKATGPLRAPKLFDERRSGSRRTTNLEVRIIAKNGPRAARERVVIITSVNASGLYNQHDHTREFSGTLGIMRDITERKQAEEERMRLENQLNHSRKMEAIGQLAGGIAHDFNNMLSGITGYAEVIKQHNLRKDGTAIDPQLDANISVILRAADRAGDLTMKLLAFSRQGKYQVIAVDLHIIIKEVLDLLAPTIDRRIVIEKRFDAQPSLTMGDPTQLENAVLNLAMNACDAMPAGGTLTFQTSTVALDESFVRMRGYHMDPGQYLLLVVSDSGVGMSASMLQRLFEPFFSTKEPGKGTGLGLASVYGTVKSHQGAIDVESGVGEGTTFRVYLPLFRGEPRTIPQPTGDIEKGSGCIMVVDDEEIVRTILGKMLEELGYTVITCNNGGEAVSTYSKQWREISLVVLDMNMPIMSGTDCFYALQKINPSVKIVISTGYTVQTEAQKLISESTVGLIQKPFKFANLAREIKRILLFGKNG